MPSRTRPARLNPLAGSVSWAISRGVSQSGNFLRAFIQLGFSEDEHHRKVYDGAWPIIAGRRVSLNARFATPDAALKMYDGGTEGPLWWSAWPDPVRGLPTAGILDRCGKTNTCPKIMEHFGSAEIWDLNLSPSFVGTSADKDIPLPDERSPLLHSEHAAWWRTRRFQRRASGCAGLPGTEFRRRDICRQSGATHRDRQRAARAFSRLGDEGHAAARERVADVGRMATWSIQRRKPSDFPTIPGVPATAPTGLMNPVRDYDWGRGFNYVDGSGVRSVVPPAVKRVIKMKAVRVDADGNELGGVPVVLRDAPLGTYLGWNIVADRVLQGPDLQLRRRHDPVRHHQG